MIYRFLVLSDEVSNFKREIKISSEATFFDLHRALLQTTRYNPDEMYSFFICDDHWRKGTEVTLYDMGSDSDVDTYLMDDTPLDELLEEEGQKLLYVFDYMTERGLFMELSEIITGQRIGDPLCTLAMGTPPPQVLAVEEFDKRNVTSDHTLDLGENFYGDSEFNDDEFEANHDDSDSDNDDDADDEPEEEEADDDERY